MHALSSSIYCVDTGSFHTNGVIFNGTAVFFQHATFTVQVVVLSKEQENVTEIVQTVIS
jgi:hypothetical protein